MYFPGSYNPADLSFNDCPLEIKDSENDKNLSILLLNKL